MKLRKSTTLLFLMLALAVLGATGFWWLFGDLPDPADLSGRLNTPSLRITDRQGRLLYEILPEGGGRHTVVPLDAIPLYLQQATIATEDGSFYSNPGVEVRGILRSFWINLKGGETLAGGSTITQQVARNLLLTSEERTQRSLPRKLREGYLAWRLARHFSKDEILGFYLNQIYYGGLTYGVDAAARTYFGKPVSELDLAESALLAGLPQAPALYNPFTDLEAATRRQHVVLERMEREGYLTPGQRELAEREPLILASTPYPMEAPHFVMLVRGRLDALLTLEEIHSHGGLEVRTTLDLDWQRLAERAVARQIEALRQSEDGLGHNVNSAALVALDPHTGEVLAMVGSPDYFDAGQAGAVNMALSPRQPGSALKPLVYAAAMDPALPAPWTPATMLLDVRTSFVTRDGQAYTPANYDSQEHGPVLLRQALGSSLNIPAVIALDHIGMDRMLETASRLGMTGLGEAKDADLSLALGGGAVSLIDLTAAYGAFANGGFRVTPMAILEVRTGDGSVIYSGQAAPKNRVLDPRVAWLVSDMLNDDDARRIGFGQNSMLRLDRPAAVKTGTTTNFYDNWTVGYTPSLAVGVWVGNTNYEPMRQVTGLTGAAPIWHQFMRGVLGNRPKEDFRQPPGLLRLEVCSLSGLLPTPECPYKRTEWFIQGTQPVIYDSFYLKVALDGATGKLANESTPPEQRVEQVVLALPPQAHPWARAQGLRLYADLAPASGAALSPSSVPSGYAQLALVSPASNSVYRLSLGLDPSAQRLRLEAVSAAELSQISLWVDGLLVASFSAPPYAAWWPLSTGRHEAWAEAVTAAGEKLSSDRVPFEVLSPP